MFSMQAAAMLLISLIFGVVGFYLTLIAKFYRQKFSKGPSYQYMQVSLAVLILGLLLRLSYFNFLPFPSLVPAVLVCLGGAGFSALAYRLYRTMMSVN